jgi:hypothetical protein
MTFAPDPLSVLYEDDTRLILDRLYAARMTGGTARTIAYIASPPFAMPDDYDGSLTVQERAFTRALYRDLKTRRPRRSIRLDWAGESLPGLGRPVTISFFTASAARRYAERLPAAQRWSDNPALRSAGTVVR